MSSCCWEKEETTKVFVISPWGRFLALPKFGSSLNFAQFSMNRPVKHLVSLIGQHKKALIVRFLLQIIPLVRLEIEYPKSCFVLEIRNPSVFKWRHFFLEKFPFYFILCILRKMCFSDLRLPTPHSILLQWIWVYMH